MPPKGLDSRHLSLTPMAGSGYHREHDSPRGPANEAFALLRWWNQVWDALTSPGEPKRPSAPQDRPSPDPGLDPLFRASPTPILVHRNGRILAANPAAASLLGYAEPRDLSGLALESVATNERALALLRMGLRTDAAATPSTPSHPQQPLRYALKHRLGHEVPVSEIGAPGVWEGESAVFAHLMEESRPAQARRAALEALMGHAPVCMLITEGMRIRCASPKLLELAGKPDLQPMGLEVHEIWGDATAFHEIHEELNRQLITQTQAELVRPHTRPDGSTIQLRLQVSRLESEGSTGNARIWVLSDITAEMQAFRAREVAEASTQAKSAFLAVMSHELRTPLNGILGLADLARARDTKAAERKEYLSQLADCAHSLADILNDILDLSKIEAGRMEIEPQAISLSDFFARIRSTYTSLAEARGLELQVSIGPGLPRSILIDPVRLRQIVANYLGNALKFTPSGRIELEASRQGDFLRIEVRDTGLGVPDEMLPRLFTPFEQARSTTRNRPAGTGLGLSICHHLARLMEGQVGAANRPEGGSLFWAEIPLKRPDAHAVAKAQDALERQDVDLSGVKVLLAEDNEINALITMRALTSAGAQAERVADGQAAVTAVESAHVAGQPFAVVLMDVQMPVMDGVQATRALRLQASGDGLRVVALTAGALAEQREECRLAGMDAYLTKPLHRDRLLAEVLLQSKLASNGPDPGLDLRY